MAAIDVLLSATKKKIQDTAGKLFTSAQQGIQNFAYNNPTKATQIINKYEKPFNVANTVIGKPALQTAKAITNFAPTFAQSAIRMNPAVQTVKQLQGFRTPSLQPTIQNQRLEDTYNLMKGYGLATTPVLGQALAGGIGVGINAASNLINKKPVFENYDKVFGQSVVDMAAYGPINKIVGAGVNALSKVPLKPVQQAMTAIKSLEQPILKEKGMYAERLGLQMAKRAISAGVKGAAEGVLSGMTRPLEEGETRQQAVKNDALMFAAMSSASQYGGDIRREKLAPIAKKIGIAFKEFWDFLKGNGFKERPDGSGLYRGSGSPTLIGSDLMRSRTNIGTPSTGGEIPQTVYHGGSKIDQVNLRKSNHSGTFYVTDDPNYAKSFGGKGSVVNEMTIDPKAKLIDMRKPTEAQMIEITKAIEKASEKNVPYGDKNFSFYPYSTKDVIQGIRDGKANYAELPQIKQILKKLGYDGQITAEVPYAKNIGIWNKDLVKPISNISNNGQKNLPISEGNLGVPASPTRIKSGLETTAPTTLNHNSIISQNTSGSGGEIGKGVKAKFKQPINAQEYIQQMQSEQKKAQKVEQGGIGAKVKSFLLSVKTKLVDSTAPIEDVLASEQKKGKYQIRPTYNVSPQIDRVIRSRELAGQFLKDNGMDKIIREVPDIDALNQYLIAKHTPEVSSQGFKTGRNAKKDAQLVEQLAPVYEPYAQKVIQYGQKLLDYAVETGLVSKETATALKAKYPNYVPLNRIFNELELPVVPEGVRKGVASLSKQTVVQGLQGSERAIQNPIESLLTKTLDAFGQGERNQAGRMLASYKDLPNNPFQLRELKKGESGINTFSYLENGVKRTFETTKEIATAAKFLDKRQLGLIGTIFSLPVRLARIGITGINLPFVASNLAKDQVSAAINSEKALQTSIANPKVFLQSLWTAVGHGKSYDEWIRSAGGGTSFDISRSAPNITVAQIRAGRNVGSKVKYTVTHPDQLFRTVENLINRGEEVTRLQQFKGMKEALIKEGRTPQDATILAAKASRENTVNFGRSGDWGKALNSVFLYLNAGIQGSRTLLRNLQARPAQTAVKIGLTAFLPVATVTAWNLSDPQRKAAYEDIREFEKDNNIVLIPPNPTKDENGKWNVIKIPLSQEIANLTIPVRKGIESLNGYDGASFMDIAGALLSTATSLNIQSPNALIGQFIPQAVKPPLESILNKNLFTGSDIVPQYINGKLSKTLPANKQVLDTTSGTARKIGGVLNVSPIKVEQFVKSTAGGVGSQVLNASDRLLNAAGVIPKSQIGGQSIAQGLTARFAQATGGQKLSDLYSKIDEANNKGIKLDLTQQVINNGKVYYPTLVKHKDGTTSYELKSEPYKGFDTTKAPTYTQSKDSPQGLGRIGLYAVSAIDDPKATLNAIMSGQPIRKVSGKTVVLERQNELGKMDEGNTQTQVDHKIALALGGTNDQSNLQILSATDNAAKGQVEVYLLNLMKSGKITKQEAQQRDLNWRQEIPNLSKQAQQNILDSVNKVATSIQESKQYQIIDKETGNRTDIDLSPIPVPTYTGYTEIDKKLKSKYTSAVTKQVNDIIALMEDGQITAQYANELISKLKKSTGTGVKKPTFPKARKIKQVKAIKMKQPKKIKVPKLKKLKALKKNKIKITQPKLVNIKPLLKGA